MPIAGGQPFYSNNLRAASYGRRDTVLDYLQPIGVDGECSKRAFATAEVAYLLLTTDVLALV
jgi:hypothetical protein